MVAWNGSEAFQSTLPVWGATSKHRLICHPIWPRFNPRSPCGERRMHHAVRASFQSFNPRSPCGERPLRIINKLTGGICFNPRSPCGERLRFCMRAAHRISVSIHAPRVGSDAILGHGAEQTLVSIHAPRVGSDFKVNEMMGILPMFQSTLPVWGATICISA